MLKRRSFLAGLVSALAAPAIVRAASLMPVKNVLWTPMTRLIWVPEGWEQVAAWRVSLRYEYDADKKILRMLDLEKEPFVVPDYVAAA